MGITRILTKPLFEFGEKVLRNWTKKGLLPDLAAPIKTSLVKHIDVNKGVDIPDMEKMFVGMKKGDQDSFESFMDLSKTLLTNDTYNKNLTTLTNFSNNKKRYKYKPFQIDETLPIDEQKRIYKQAASDYIFDAETKAGKTVRVSEFHKKYGKLRVEGEGELDLKYKTKDAQGKKDFQPKLKETTAKETAKRKGRETPWVTEKDQIRSILKEVGEEAKLAKLLKLIKTQYKAKKDAIKAAGLSKGHQKALHNGGLDVPENIIGEQGVSTKEIRGNYARQYKEDLSDEELMKQGAFTGTLKEYILMKLKELE